MVCQSTLDSLLKKLEAAVNEDETWDDDIHDSLWHAISRQIDAHDHLWISFARHLGLDEVFCEELYLYAHGGGSPALKFLEVLNQRKPSMRVRKFKKIVAIHEFEDVMCILDRVQDNDIFLNQISYLLWRNIATCLNTPEEAPRWKLIAQSIFPMRETIKNIETGIGVGNLYSPTTITLSRYQQMCPYFDNFKLIREFLEELRSKDCCAIESV